MLRRANLKPGKVPTEIGLSNVVAFSDVDRDQEHDPINNVIVSPLLSQTDVTLILLDQRNEEWDNMLFSFILNNFKYKGDEEGNDKIVIFDTLM